MTALRMTRATWYKHRFAMAGLPAVFLLAALALVADGAVQRRWLGVHHLNGCLAASTETGGSWPATASLSRPPPSPCSLRYGGSAAAPPTEPEPGRRPGIRCRLRT